MPGFRVGVGSYYPNLLHERATGRGRAEAHAAWAAGYHGGRLFALREIAYDKKERRRSPLGYQMPQTDDPICAHCGEPYYDGCDCDY